MTNKKTVPLNQSNRIACSLPLSDADLDLGNANWSKGLQERASWAWSGHLSSDAFPNNLAKYLLFLPGVFEQQLDYSTTLVFDEPSYRNGSQVSGFINRVTRELVISYIGQARRCWYTTTHHAILGKFTCDKHKVPETDYIKRWSHLDSYESYAGYYSELDLAVLDFAKAFISDAKSYNDKQYQKLRSALAAENKKNYVDENYKHQQVKAARRAYAKVLLNKDSNEDAIKKCHRAMTSLTNEPSEEEMTRKINAQILELSFLCLQFSSLSSVFTGLNIPDEAFLNDFMQQVLPSEVIEHLNKLNAQKGEGMLSPLPESVDIPFDEILSGRVTVEPAEIKGKRTPRLQDHELTTEKLHPGVSESNLNRYFPDNLVRALRHHPELARFAVPYSLPLLFNEDEWRNGVQSSGFVSRRLKEIVIQKVYKLNRSRYGIKHHTYLFYKAYLDEYGVGCNTQTEFTEQQKKQATQQALQHASQSLLYIHSPEDAPKETYTDLEKTSMQWVESLLKTPHKAYYNEAALRRELDKENRWQIAIGTRMLADDVDTDQALLTLQHQQVAEIATVSGHMDGLGRLMIMLQLEPRTEIPDVLLTAKRSKAVFTVNELFANPELSKQIKQRLATGEENISISSAKSGETAEF